MARSKQSARKGLARVKAPKKVSAPKNPKVKKTVAKSTAPKPKARPKKTTVAKSNKTTTTAAAATTTTTNSVPRTRRASAASNNNNDNHEDGHLSFIMNQYMESQCGGLNYKNQTQTNVMLILDDGFLFAHAVILQGLSPFFEKMFESQGPFIQDIRKILMPDCSVAVMSKVLQLMYNSQVSLKSEDEQKQVYDMLRFLEICPNEELILVNGNNSVPTVQISSRNSQIQPESGNSQQQNILVNNVNNDDEMEVQVNSNNDMNENEPQPSSSFSSKAVEGDKAVSKGKNTPQLKPKGNARNKLALGSPPLSSKIVNKKNECAGNPNRHDVDGGPSNADTNGNNNNNDDDNNDKGKRKRTYKKATNNISNVKKQKIENDNSKDNKSNNNINADERSNGENAAAAAAATTNGNAAHNNNNNTNDDNNNGGEQTNREIVEESTNNDDDDSVEFRNGDWLLRKAKKCQKCKQVYGSPAEASVCLARHKVLRCYFCFRLFQNTELLFRHFTRAHKNTRENYLQCPFCEQSVPFKSVSCHCISLHMTSDRVPVRKKSTTIAPAPSTSSMPGPSNVVRAGGNYSNGNKVVNIVDPHKFDDDSDSDSDVSIIEDTDSD